MKPSPKSSRRIIQRFLVNDILVQSFKKFDICKGTCECKLTSCLSSERTCNSVVEWLIILCTALFVPLWPYASLILRSPEKKSFKASRGVIYTVPRAEINLSSLKVSKDHYSSVWWWKSSLDLSISIIESASFVPGGLMGLHYWRFIPLSPQRPKLFSFRSINNFFSVDFLSFYLNTLYEIITFD